MQKPSDPASILPKIPALAATGIEKQFKNNRAASR
jgi:hypothetical protein